MNWMIDGAHGDLYRKAMGYPALTPHDEWEIGRSPKKAAAPAPSRVRSFLSHAHSWLAQAFTHQPLPERRVS
jgi:hypothetical protein